MASPIGTALIGWGLAGTAFHGPLLATLPQLFSLRAIVRSSAAATPIIWGVPVVGGIESVLADASIQLVVVASPDSTHYDIAKRALLADKHVLIDKPFAESVVHADELLSIAHARGLVCTSFQNRRYDADFLTLVALLREQRLGTLLEYEGRFDRFRPAVASSWKESERGTLANLGPHVIDQAVLLFGAPDRVIGDVAALREGALTDDFFCVTLLYGGMGGGAARAGALFPAPHRVFLRSSTLAAANTVRFMCHGTRGSFVKGGLDIQEAVMRGLLPPPEGVITVGSGQAALPTGVEVDAAVWSALLKGAERVVLPGARGWAAEPPSQFGTLTTPAANGELVDELVPSLPGDYAAFYVDLAAAIKGGGEPGVTPHHVRTVMRIMEAARASSAAGGAPVALAV